MSRDPEEFYNELGYAIDTSKKLVSYLEELKFTEYDNTEVLSEKLKPVLDNYKYLHHKIQSLKILLN